MDGNYACSVKKLAKLTPGPFHFCRKNWEWERGLQGDKLGMTPSEVDRKLFSHVEVLLSFFFFSPLSDQYKTISFSTHNFSLAHPLQFKDLRFSGH